MAMYSAEIKYKYGSGRATTSTRIVTNQLKGKTESAVLDYLRNKHRSKSDLQILIIEINWK
jgi:hypothetical protein